MSEGGRLGSGASGSGSLGPGTRLGSLFVESEVARGGFAVVYRARDTMLDRPVALKVLSADAAHAGRLLDEARRAASIQSPHVVTIFAVRELPDGHAALEMEFVDGGTLQALLEREGRLDAARTSSILRGVLLGLRAAHARGVLHRDVKPGNVLLAADGTPKLADFGLARALGPEPFADAGGAVVGTPWYMAPELLLHEDPSEGTDLWSVGVLAFEMLTGSLPFAAGDIPALFSAVVNAEPRPLPATVPANLQMLVARCLTKSRDRRVANCDELLAVLDRASGAAWRTGDGARAATPRLIGRDAEVARVRAALDAAARGDAPRIVVSGEPGIGRTSFLDHARRTAAERGFTVVGAALSPVEGPVRALLRAARSRLGAETGDGATLRLPTAAFGPAAGVLDRWLRGRGAAEMSSGVQSAWALEHLLVGLAGGQPLLVAIDDAQHAHRDDEVLVADLARRLSATGSVFLVAVRTEPGTGAPTFGDLRDAERIVLGPLGAGDVLALLERETGARVDAEVAARIAERSDGNPLVALELFRHLRETAAVADVGGAWTPVPGADLGSAPSRLADLVAARIARLAPEDRELLEIAAVDGRDFDGRALAAVAGAPLVATLRRLQKVCQTTGLVAPSRTGFRFANPVVREVLRDSIAPELRVETHRALAETLESRSEDADPERLGSHWESCGELARARPHLARAAQRAADRCEPRRLADLLSRAGLLRETSPEALWEHREPLLRSLLYLVDRDHVRDTLRILCALRDEALRRGDEQTALQADVAAVQTEAALPGGVQDEVRLRRAVGAKPVTRANVVAAYALAGAAKRRGELGDAEAWLRRLLQFAEVIGAEELEAYALDQMGNLARRGGRFAESENAHRAACRMFRRLGRRANAAVSVMNACASAMLAGRFDGLAEQIDDARRVLEVEGFPVLAGGASHLRSELAYARGDLAAAAAVGEVAIAALRPHAPVPALAAALMLRALLAIHRDAPVAAARDLDDAESAAGTPCDASLVASHQAARALCCAVAGDPAGAAAAAERFAKIRAVSEEALDDALVTLAIAAVLGLPAPALARVAATRPAVTSGPVAAARDRPGVGAIAVGAMAEALTGTADPERLRDAAATLRTRHCGHPPGILDTIADHLDAEALRLEGRLDEARSVDAHAASRAASVPHAPLARALRN